jgi:serine/threonine-protein kinase RsbW
LLRLRHVHRRRAHQRFPACADTCAGICFLVVEMAQQRQQPGTHESRPRHVLRSKAELRALLEQALRGRRETLSDGELCAALRRAGVKHPHAEGPLWLHEFSFGAELDEVPPARRRVAELCLDCGLVGEPLFDLVLATGEALANAVRHGSPGGDGDRVRVRVGIADHAVAVEVRDRGHGFADCGAELPGSLETGGRGIPFMRSLADEVTFDCSAGGTSVLLVKRAA